MQWWLMWSNKIILSIFLLKIPVTKGRSTSLDIEINQVNSYKCITKRRRNYSMWRSGFELDEINKFIQIQ